MVKGCVPPHHIYHNTHKLYQNIMNHFDIIPLLELNFCFEIYEGLQRVRLFTNKINNTITGMIINEHDEIFVVTYSRRGEWATTDL